MATLQSIGFTLIGGGSLGLVSFALFAMAMMGRSTYIAPRATARPAAVIYNPKAEAGHSQYRGNVLFGWIPWTLGLTYDTLLRGVPGTGTREGGMTGNLLKVNLDGIVLLRFHALGLRVAGMATFLCLCVLLPVYSTAGCYENPSLAGCVSRENATLTNYERTTLANVPADTPDGPDYIVSGENAAVRGRLYTTVVCFWILVAFTCWQLRREWVEMLALRRVYYLEYDVWGARRAELEQTMLYKATKTGQKKTTSVSTHKNDYYDDDDFDNGEEHLTQREPWIPHPEPRDTIPNIQIYSLLVGGLPSLPENNIDTFSKRQSVDWQLQLTATFFDHCVPNQPGFSSSVAAVTIVPSARELALAWRKWYTAAAKLRRLRYIRELIADRRHYAIADADDDSSADDDNDDDESSSGDDDIEAQILPKTESPQSKNLRKNWPKEKKPQQQKPPQQQHGKDWPSELYTNTPKGFASTHADYKEDSDRTAPPMPRPVPLHPPTDVPGIYENPQRHQSYYRAVLGVMDDDMDALAFGPEQAAVYSREFAQAAAPCCPRGFCEEWLRFASIDELMHMEVAVAKEVHEANLALKLARQKATLAEDDDDDDDDDSIYNLPEQHTDPSFGSIPDASEQSCASVQNFSSPKRRHRRTTSLEQKDIPSSFHLEAQLYEKGSAKSRELAKPQMARAATTGRSIDEATQKYHRRTVSMEGTKIPDDLQLEADLYKKGSSLSNKEPSDKRRPTQNVQPYIDIEDQPRPSVNDIIADDVVPGILPSPSATWGQVEALVNESVTQSSRSNERPKIRAMATGQWQFPSISSLLGRTRKHVKNAKEWTQKTPIEAVENLARNSTFAVVTFTSRQAAVAARNTLADGRGVDRWSTLKDLPIPPLADAAACDLLACRNCCRPLALGVNDRQKNCRHYLTIAALATIYTLYTVPLSLASTLVSPEDLNTIFPDLAETSQNLGFEITGVLSGLCTALIWSTFFAVCPVMFKVIANFGSRAVSVANAEFKALQYYWWFMVLTAFSGQILAEMVWKFFTERNADASDLRTILRNIASTVPSQVAVNWLNWILFRLLAVLPFQYMLQVNTFLFAAFGLKCCSRVVRGGGPGGPTPYRIYVDSGVVLMSAIALAPASPLVAPAAFFYFLYCQPLLRRNLIFMYRPKYDGGGLRWPFVFDMCISSMIMGALLLAGQMGLKEAPEPALLAGLTLVPILMYQKESKRKFLRAFKDASLLQSSLLDGWDTEDTSFKKREEFRRFLVDAHKAAYVPVCLAATDTDDFLTIEPALVLPLDSDPDKDAIEDDFQMSTDSLHSLNDSGLESTPSVAYNLRPTLLTRRQSQRGVMVRRSVNIMSTADRRATLCKLQSCRALPVQQEDFHVPSPFESVPSRRASSSGGRPAMPSPYSLQEKSE